MKLLSLRSTAVAALAPLVMAACATPQMAGPPPSMAEASTAAPAYVAMAGSSDLYEMNSSRMVLPVAQNPAVRAFAEMMVRDHTMTTQQVMAAAQQSGMTPPPPALAPHHAAMLRDLEAAPAADRERLYVQQQVTAHQEALTLHSAYARSGDREPLRAAASAAVPIVQGHLAQVQAMQGG